MSSQAETASDASNSDDSPSCVPSEPLIISEDQGSLDIERNGSFDDNDDDTDFEDAPKVAFTMGNSKNCGAVYLPNKNKPDDIDEGKLSTSGKTTNTKRAPPNRPAAVSKKPVRAKKAAPAPPSKKAVVPAKKGKASESEVDSLREKANAYYASKVPAIPEGSGPRISQRKKTSRSKVVIDEDSSDESDDEDISMRCSRQLVNAYQRANTSEDADDELRCLKRAKVLLPNGFKQLPPLFSRHGEELSKLFNQESADDCTDNKDNAETNDDNNSPGQGNPEDPCPVCLEKVHRKRYQCEECLVFMCWFCLAEWLKVATTCPHCRDEKDIIIVPSDLDSSDEE
ncbi:uncharacterized protein LOC117648300 isoform X1 [Thrips palmi]|uniref:Uncharacterized protein LOC117648300 isoform X1 n=1 Tax=Thrips palmi TaxID=161013 RepID=A0A6P8ZCQ7_THRPL|nr:uncharacterized protein LOC117648300 isoform X1 [Thrips palmi]